MSCGCQDNAWHRGLTPRGLLSGRVGRCGKWAPAIPLVFQRNEQLPGLRREGNAGNWESVMTVARVWMAAAMICGLLGMGGSFCAASGTTSKSPDLTGVWMGVAFVPGQGIGPWKNTPWMPEPAFTVWGAAESKRLSDPQISRGSYCNTGQPVIMMSGSPLFPMQIASAPGVIIFLMEGMPIQRRVYVDGRGHPADPDPTYFGNSIGHWEGDVLVVDTVAIKSSGRPLNGYVAPAVIATPADYAPRLPGSDQLHLSERLRLVGHGQFLEEELTISDPKVYTNSFTAKFYFQRRPDLDVLELYCEENPRPESEGYVDTAAEGPKP
jgi:hypothetical protein